MRVFKDDSREVLYEMKNKNVDGVGYTDYEMEWINQDRRDIGEFLKEIRDVRKKLFRKLVGKLFIFIFDQKI